MVFFRKDRLLLLSCCRFSDILKVCFSTVFQMFRIFIISLLLGVFFFKDFSIDPEDKYLLKDLNIETIFSLVTE